MFGGAASDVCDAQNRFVCDLRCLNIRGIDLVVIDVFSFCELVEA